MNKAAFFAYLQYGKSTGKTLERRPPQGHFQS